MKSLHCYLLVAVLGLSAILAPNVFANAVQPVREIDVIVKKNPGTAARTQHATVDANGTIVVNLPGAGDYTITYASGPLKGQVLKTVKTTKADSVSCKVAKAYLQGQASATNKSQ